MRDSSDKTPIWKAIANALRSDLAEGRYAPGDKLPTEAALADRFGVNRHTVRHGISVLVEEGLVRTRRGAGAVVAATPTDYPIGNRVRFHENLIAAGRRPEKRMLALDERAQVEEHFWRACRAVLNTARKVEYAPEDLDDLEKALADTMFLNMSVFQSIPDAWAIGQMFPVMPIQRLDEEMTCSQRPNGLGIPNGTGVSGIYTVRQADDGRALLSETRHLG